MFVENFQSSYETSRVKLGVDKIIACKRATFIDRIDCWKDTQKTVANMTCPESVKLRFDPSRWPPVERPFDGIVRIDDADTIDCALDHLDKGFNPVALNLADDCYAGGCVDIGSGAQEESLFRRTALCGTLDFSMYPIKDDEGIYSPDVVVLKTSEADGWVHIAPDQRKHLSFLTVPGVKYPLCINIGSDLGTCEAMLNPHDAQRLSVKIRTMLQIAHDKGHDSVVLGASGCGAWKCPPRHVANVFKQVIQECHGAFRVVTIAILRIGASGERKTDNFEVFQATFSFAQ